jgi:hypothetical protein
MYGWNGMTVGRRQLRRAPLPNVLSHPQPN